MRASMRVLRVGLAAAAACLALGGVQGVTARAEAGKSDRDNTAWLIDATS